MAANNGSSASKFDLLSAGGSSTSKARVVFRSYEWESAKPNLANTKAIITNGPIVTIHLYLPANFSENYGASWEVTDSVTALIDTKNIDAWKASGYEGIDNATKSLGGLTSAAKFDQGKTSFPGKFLTFISGNPIEPTFTFDLLPMTAAEGGRIVKMCQDLKKTILPKFHSGYLKYPNVWSMEFTGINGLGHPDTPNFYHDMALTGVKLSYGGGEQSALVFKDGNPVTVTVTMDFKSIKHAYLE